MQPDELRAIRKGLGWTQQQMADALGMSRKAVYEMEGGKAPIERRTALAAIHLGSQGSEKSVEKATTRRQTMQNLPIYDPMNIDLTEQRECVYREGSYEHRWMAPRYMISVYGYANACKNEWAVPVETQADLLDPLTAAKRIILKDAEHRTVIGAKLWDAVANTHFTCAVA